MLKKLRNSERQECHALDDFIWNLPLDIAASYHCMQFQGKLTNQTRENGKKPSFRTNFAPFGPNFPPSPSFFH